MKKHLSNDPNHSPWTSRGRNAVIGAAAACALAAALVSGTLPGCGGGGSSSAPAGPRGYPALLAALGDEVIVPGYEAASGRFAAMEDAARNLCGNPSEASLESARSGWRNAIAAWLQVEWITF